VRQRCSGTYNVSYRPPKAAAAVKSGHEVRFGALEFESVLDCVKVYSQGRLAKLGARVLARTAIVTDMLSLRSLLLNCAQPRHNTLRMSVNTMLTLALKQLEDSIHTRLSGAKTVLAASGHSLSAITLAVFPFSVT
jgi:hypothetical protein